MLLQWGGDVLAINIYLRSTFGFGDKTGLRKRATEETQTLGAIIFHDYMTYENRYQKGFWDNLKLSFKVSTFPTILLILTTTIYLILSIFGKMTEKGADKLVTIIIMLLVMSVFLTIVTLIKGAPNEKSVTIGENSLTINFPLFKKNRIVPFNSIICIHANRTNDKGEAQIRIKSIENKLGLNEDYEIVTSLKVEEWREIATIKKLPLIINSDMEEKVRQEWGIFGPTYLSGDDYYVIKKSFMNDQKIDLAEWTNYLNNNKKIIFLGTEELINITDDIQKEARRQYSLNTDFGLKTLDFFDGQLVVTYEKDKHPIEIEEITTGLKLEYKNISDLK